jgi:GT2 family glycosyltransferase
MDIVKNIKVERITSPEVNDFSAFLISKEIYNEVGPFDENLKGGTLEDWDYTIRLKEKAFSILPCPTFKVLHEKAATTKLIENDPEIVKLREESLQYYRKKWGDGRHILP